jgi:hypothetical protein
MPENENATPVQEVQVVTPKVIPANKVAKLTKRTPEELDAIAPNKMNDLEKNEYIKYLRDQVAALTAKSNGLDHNCQQAYEKVRLFQDAYQLKSEKLQKNNAFIAAALNVCQTSILNLIKEDK